MTFEPLFPGFCRKAVTFGFDDGEDYDRRVSEIMRENGLSGTFFLISGQFGLKVPGFKRYGRITEVRRVKESDAGEIYRGMEIASHSQAHKLPTDGLDEALGDSLERLSDVAGYPVKGLAYPGGEYNDELLSLIKNYGVEYARTVEYTYGFSLPDNFYKWAPTCHFAYKNIYALADEFESAEKGLSLFYVMGHSYEMTKGGKMYSFEGFSRICERFAQMKDVYKADNISLAIYIKAMRSLEITDDGIVNSSSTDIYGVSRGKRLVIPAGKNIRQV